MNENVNAAAAEQAELVLTRVLDAPRELVFQVWTDPEHFKRWWGPKGFTLNVVRMDVRPGGTFLGSQTSPEGHVMWGTFEYREVTPPEKLVFVNSFSDENGNVIRAPFNENWPLRILNTLTFEDEGGKTRLTMRGTPLDATPAELQTFQSAHSMLQQGFKGTFEQLDEYLAKARG